jgi:CrcB protein
MSKSWTMRVAVLLGGLVGSLARYAVQNAVDDGGLPWGTLTVNVAGTFLLGLLTSRVARSRRPELAAAFLGVGALGAFTTFSALVGQLEGMSLPKAMVYASVSVVLGLAAAISGIRLGRTQA